MLDIGEAQDRARTTIEAHFAGTRAGIEAQARVQSIHMRLKVKGDNSASDRLIAPVIDIARLMWSATVHNDVW